VSSTPRLLEDIDQARGGVAPAEAALDALEKLVD